MPLKDWRLLGLGRTSFRIQYAILTSVALYIFMGIRYEMGRLFPRVHRVNIEVPALPVGAPHPRPVFYVPGSAWPESIGVGPSVCWWMATMLLLAIPGPML